MFPTNKRLIPLLILLLAAIIAGSAAYSALKSDKTPISSGTPLIGGAFTLTAHTGARVSDTDFRGKFMLVFFGYTYCPDICPAELQLVSAALDKMGSKSNDIQPLFVTIDPERDTPPVLKEYMGNFHPKFLGLTGTPDEIAAVAKTYRVYYAKSANGGGEDYLMDHSSIIYLMDRNGKFLKHFTYRPDVQALADDLSRAIAAR